MNFPKRYPKCLRVMRAGVFSLSIAFAAVATLPRDAPAGNLFSKNGSGGQSGKTGAKKAPFKGLFSSRKNLRAVPVVPESPVTPPSDNPSRKLAPVVTATSFSGPLQQVQKTNPDQVRVFILGDSQSLTSFGPELQKKLTENGYEVLFHGVKNGTPYFWEGKWPSPVLTRIYTRAAMPEECGQFKEVAMTPRSVREYVESFDPDIFVFQAGTNFEVDLAGENVTKISGMISESAEAAAAKGARVLWIGPPDARDDVKSVEFQERSTATLRAALADMSEKQGYTCFLDSRPVCLITSDSGGDGEHPTHQGGLVWAGEAARWVHDSISRLSCDGNLRPIRAVQLSPLPQSFSQQAAGDAESSAKAFAVELQLVAKSDPGDIKTLPYTDAFSVYQYRLKNAEDILPELAGKGLILPASSTPGEATEAPTIYVLHWAVHNNGAGPRATGITSRKVGETYAMKLIPLAEHPLEKALGTMVQFNDFDDFMAPVFLTTNFLEERAF